MCPLWVYAHECRFPWKLEASDPLELELEMVVSYLMWVVELNSAPLEEQQVLLSTELSLQLPVCIFKDLYSSVYLGHKYLSVDCWP